jgi:replication factor A1
LPEFKVKDLTPKASQVNIELEIVSLGEPRAFNSYRGQGTVANAAGKDETGEISITLWGDQYKLVKQGDKVKIENGYVTEYNGKLQISTGKFGTITVIGKTENAGDETEEENE